MAAELEQKFLREAGATVGRERARAGFAAGVALAPGDLGSFLELCARG
jgi:hypothetical protein